MPLSWLNSRTVRQRCALASLSIIGIITITYFSVYHYKSEIPVEDKIEEVTHFGNISLVNLTRNRRNSRDSPTPGENVISFEGNAKIEGIIRNGAVFNGTIVFYDSSSKPTNVSCILEDDPVLKLHDVGVSDVNPRHRTEKSDHEFDANPFYDFEVIANNETDKNHDQKILEDMTLGKLSDSDAEKISGTVTYPTKPTTTNVKENFPPIAAVEIENNNTEAEQKPAPVVAAVELKKSTTSATTIAGKTAPVVAAVELGESTTLSTTVDEKAPTASKEKEPEVISAVEIERSTTLSTTIGREELPIVAVEVEGSTIPTTTFMEEELPIVAVEVEGSTVPITTIREEELLVVAAVEVEGSISSTTNENEPLVDIAVEVEGSVSSGAIIGGEESSTSEELMQPKLSNGESIAKHSIASSDFKEGNEGPLCGEVSSYDGGGMSADDELSQLGNGGRNTKRVVEILSSVKQSLELLERIASRLRRDDVTSLFKDPILKGSLDSRQMPKFLKKEASSPGQDLRNTVATPFAIELVDQDMFSTINNVKVPRPCDPVEKENLTRLPSEKEASELLSKFRQKLNESKVLLPPADNVGTIDHMNRNLKAKDGREGAGSQKHKFEESSFADELSLDSGLLSLFGTVMKMGDNQVPEFESKVEDVEKRGHMARNPFVTKSAVAISAEILENSAWVKSKSEKTTVETQKLSTSDKAEGSTTTEAMVKNTGTTENMVEITTSKANYSDGSTTGPTWKPSHKPWDEAGNPDFVTPCACDDPHATHSTDDPHATHSTDDPHATHSTDDPHATHSTDDPHSGDYDDCDDFDFDDDFCDLPSCDELLVHHAFEDADPPVINASSFNTSELWIHDVLAHIVNISHHIAKHVKWEDKTSPQKSRVAFESLPVVLDGLKLVRNIINGSLAVSKGKKFVAEHESNNKDVSPVTDSTSLGNELWTRDVLGRIIKVSRHITNHLRIHGMCIRGNGNELFEILPLVKRDLELIEGVATDKGSSVEETRPSNDDLLAEPPPVVDASSNDTSESWFHDALGSIMNISDRIAKHVKRIHGGNSTENEKQESEDDSESMGEEPKSDIRNVRDTSPLMSPLNEIEEFWQKLTNRAKRSANSPKLDTDYKSEQSLGRKFLRSGFLTDSASTVPLKRSQLDGFVFEIAKKEESISIEEACKSLNGKGGSCKIQEVERRKDKDGNQCFESGDEGKSTTSSGGSRGDVRACGEDQTEQSLERKFLRSGLLPHSPSKLIGAKPLVYLFDDDNPDGVTSNIPLKRSQLDGLVVEIAKKEEPIRRCFGSVDGGKSAIGDVHACGEDQTEQLFKPKFLRKGFLTDSSSRVVGAKPLVYLFDDNNAGGIASGFVAKNAKKENSISIEETCKSLDGKKGKCKTQVVERKKDKGGNQCFESDDGMKSTLSSDAPHACWEDEASEFRNDPTEDFEGVSGTEEAPVYEGGCKGRNTRQIRKREYKFKQHPRLKLFRSNLYSEESSDLLLSNMIGMQSLINSIGRMGDPGSGVTGYPMEIPSLDDLFKEIMSKFSDDPVSKDFLNGGGSRREREAKTIEEVCRELSEDGKTAPDCEEVRTPTTEQMVNDRTTDVQAEKTASNCETDLPTSSSNTKETVPDSETGSSTSFPNTEQTAPDCETGSSTSFPNTEQTAPDCETDSSTSFPNTEQTAPDCETGSSTSFPNTEQTAPDCETDSSTSSPHSEETAPDCVANPSTPAWSMGLTGNYSDHGGKNMPMKTTSLDGSTTPVDQPEQSTAHGLTEGETLKHYSNKTLYEKVEGGVCLDGNCVLRAAELIRNLDLKSDPCEDFYRFSCGGFTDEMDIPQYKVAVNQFNVLNDEQLDRIKRLLSRPISKQDFPVIQEAKKFYNTCLNEDARRYDVGGFKKFIAELGVWPVLESGETNRFDLVNHTVNFFQMGVNPNQFMSFTIEAYQGEYLLHVSSAKLSLPSTSLLARKRENYTLFAYHSFLKAVAELLGAKSNVEGDLLQILVFEGALAEIVSEAQEWEQAGTYYSKMRLEEVMKNYSYINWLDIMQILTPQKDVPSTLGDIVLKYPPYVEKLIALLKRTPARDIANYAIWRGIARLGIILCPEISNFFHTYFHDITNAFERLDGIFDGTIIVLEDRPRWVECIDATKRAYSLALNYLYAKNFFDLKSKAIVSDIAHAIKGEIKNKITKTSIMDDNTRALALDKINAMELCIGYSDELMDSKKISQYYRSVPSEQTSFLHWYREMNLFEMKKYYSNVNVPAKHCGDLMALGDYARYRFEKNDFRKLLKYQSQGEEIECIVWMKDHSEGPSTHLQNELLYWIWHEIPFILSTHMPILSDKEFLNSCLHISNFEVIAARFLQSPLFHASRPIYLNFGAVGLPMAHFMLHSVTFEGRFFDEQGKNLPHGWWGLKTLKKFMAKSQCLAEDYIRLKPSNIMGIKPLNEFVDDKGAFEVVYDAYQQWIKGKSLPRLPGLEKFSKNQAFWMSFGTTICAKDRFSSTARVRLSIGVRNHEGFARDYGCRVDTKMNPSRKCTLWL